MNLLQQEPGLCGRDARCVLFLGHEGNCQGFAWDGRHPPPAPPLPEPCGCDESKALRLELTALRARLARAEGGA